MFRYEMFINLSLGFLLIFSSEEGNCLLIMLSGLCELYYLFLWFWVWPYGFLWKVF